MTEEEQNDLLDKIEETLMEGPKITISLADLFDMDDLIPDTDDISEIDWDILFNTRNHRLVTNICISKIFLFNLRPIVGIRYEEKFSNLTYTHFTINEKYEVHNFFFGVDEAVSSMGVIFGVDGQYTKTSFNLNDFRTLESCLENKKKAKDTIITMYFKKN